jgi:hypothetical protein
MTCVPLGQETVPEKVSTAVTEGVVEADLEVMTSRSPTAAAAAKVQEAVTAEEWRVHDAPVYAMVCAPTMGAVNSRTVAISIFIGHDLLKSRSASRSERRHEDNLEYR